MVGDPEVTSKGVKVTLTRMDTPALYGMRPFINVTVEAEFHTDHRLRIKVVVTMIIYDGDVCTLEAEL